MRILVLALVAGCSFGDNLVNRAAIDAPVGRDARDVDAPETVPDAPAHGVGDHLLLTEIGSIGTAEFVEIYNPTGDTIDLSTYYLSDANNYWQLPASTVALSSSDFLERFPDGSTIAAGAVITVALEPTGFQAAYGIPPTYGFDTSAGTPAMLPIVVTTSPTITDTGEMVALFHWDGVSDLVDDVDLVIAGNAPTAANSPTAKQPVDGPDADSVATPYAADAMTITDMPADAVGAQTYKRIALEDGHELHAGTGNGITGHDETSEDLRATWDTTYTPGTPGEIPDSLR
jgi:hypothetical protein